MLSWLHIYTKTFSLLNDKIRIRQNDSVEILNIEKAFKGVINYLIKLYFWSDLVYVKDRIFSHENS